MRTFSLTATDTNPTHKSSLQLLPTIHSGYKLIEMEVLPSIFWFLPYSPYHPELDKSLNWLETGVCWGRLPSCLDNICPCSLLTCTALIYKLPGALVFPSLLIFVGFHRQQSAPPCLSSSRDPGPQKGTQVPMKGTKVLKKGPRSSTVQTT